MDGQSLERTIGWMDRGTDWFNGRLASLTDDDLLAPSPLPGWSRLHVVSHIARNARAMRNLVRWAQTGVETPMYPSPEHRRDDIEAGARLPPDEVRADALAEADLLKAAVSAMPSAAWTAPIRTALGLSVTADAIPWMRSREVWVHAVDLGADATFEDIDEEVAGALYEEAARQFVGRQDCPAVVLVPVPPGNTVAIGPEGSDPVRVSGTTNALAGWLLGRTDGRGLTSEAPLPRLPPWM
jgi:maleylpyruvate isomerase